MEIESQSFHNKMIINLYNSLSQSLALINQLILFIDKARLDTTKYQNPDFNIIKQNIINKAKLNFEELHSNLNKNSQGKQNGNNIQNLLLQLHRTQPLTNYLLGDPQIYIEKAFPKKQQLEWRYYNIGENTDSKPLLRLNHQNISFVNNIEYFLKFDWRNVQELNLVNCQLNNHDWRKLVEYSHLFENLSRIWIHTNNISDIQLFDLQKFKTLKEIHFRAPQHKPSNPLARDSYVLNQNNLSKHSIQYLKQYEKQNPWILVFY